MGFLDTVKVPGKEEKKATTSSSGFLGNVVQPGQQPKRTLIPSKVLEGVSIDFPTTISRSTPQTTSRGTLNDLAELAGAPLRAGLQVAQTAQEAFRPGSTRPINPKEDLGGYASFFLGERPIEPLQSEISTAIAGGKLGGQGPLAAPISYIGKIGEVALNLLPLYGGVAGKPAAKIANSIAAKSVVSRVPEAAPIKPLPVVSRVEEPVVPIEPVTPIVRQPVVTPSVGSKTSKVSQSIETKAIEDGLTRTFGDLAEYDPITIKDQARQASEILKDMDRVNRIIDGVEALPSSLRVGSFIKAVEDLALVRGDAELARKLATSRLTSETSIFAQELRTLAERNPESPVEAIRSVLKAREAAVARRTIGGIERARKKAIADIKSSIAKVPKEDWSSFVDSITC